MPKIHTLAASLRHDSANRVRRRGQIPGVIYGRNVASEPVAVDSREFARVFAQAGSTTLVALDVEGTARNILIREVQYHPINDNFLHIDFYQVRMDEALHAQVPLKFVGESAAVKDLGGIFVRNIDTVEVRALPKDLPHDLEVDVSILAKFNDTIHIADLKLPSGVAIINAGTDVIALVQPPRSEEELKSLEEEVKEDVESIEATAEKKPEEEAPAEGEPTAPDAEAKKN